MFGILEAAAVPHSGVFDTYQALILDLNKHMGRQGFKIVKARSHRRKPGGDAPGNEIVRCDLVCDKGGRSYRCLATKHKTKTKKTDCPWKAKAVHRKAVGGWVLSILCDQHNHEAGTPEPPTPVAVGDADAEDDAEMQTARAPPLGPQLDVDTSAAFQLTGISNHALRLTGDTFQQFKTDYRKMTQSDRLNALAQLQLQVAAIYAVQNEDMQRRQHQNAQDWRRLEVDANKEGLALLKRRSSRQQEGQVDQDHDLIAPNTAHAPEALMQEQHFQLADAAVGVPDMDLAHFSQSAGQSRRTGDNRTNSA